MKHLVIRIVLGAFLTLQFVPSVLSQSGDDICDTTSIHALLTDIQTAQQNEELDQAEELVEVAIRMLEEISLNCSIEAIVVPEPTQASESVGEPDNSLTANKEDGFYLVGIDIMPGHWETTGSGPGCYWARSDVSGDTLSNHFGNAGGTITIQETDFQVEFDDCGTIIYIENREAILLADADQPKESGFYTVGIEIAPGLWRSLGSDSNCYMARLDDSQDIIDNHFGNSGITINIQPTDYEVEFDDCGTWEYLGASQ